LNEMGERIATLEAEVANLSGWQKTQNGSIQRVEGKIDRLIFWMLGQTVAFLLSAFLLIVRLMWH
jgi:GH25 family lysozyme M1 (1,4-beta-N-acetylmuramidase)